MIFFVKEVKKKHFMRVLVNLSLIVIRSFGIYCNGENNENIFIPKLKVKNEMKKKIYKNKNAKQKKNTEEN